MYMLYHYLFIEDFCEEQMQSIVVAKLDITGFFIALYGSFWENLIPSLFNAYRKE